MAILIRSVVVDEVPDDRCPEIVSCGLSSGMHFPTTDPFAPVVEELTHEVCQPYNIQWWRPPTREEVEAGDFERYTENGEMIPKKELHVLYMPEEVQKKLGYLHDTWVWLCCQYQEQADDIQRLRGDLRTAIEVSTYKSGKLDWYLNAPWYKRVWRVLWLKN